jgi:uncharacterized protein (DUF488 family)
VSESGGPSLSERDGPPVPAPATSARLYTVGHSNHTTARLLELLALHEIEAVVDVRSAPYSRFAPHFNRESLEPTITHAKLRYLFMGEELGGRQLGKIVSLAERLAAYEQVAANPAFQTGIGRLLRGATEYAIVLLCAEEDPTECHRRVWVARALRERGADVQHIRGDGHLDADAALRRLEPPAGRQLGLFDA